MTTLRNTGRLGFALTAVGVSGILYAHWMVFFWVPTEASMGIIQRATYIHVPMAWIALLAFAVSAFASAIYLWLGEDRADAAAAASAEGGLFFCTGLLIAGSLWGRVAWGTFWAWEPRLTLTLLLWFIILGYFLVRHTTEGAERGKRLAAVIAIFAALMIPLIHMSVYWFRSLHPEPVFLRPEGPNAASEFSLTLGVSFLFYLALFLGLFAFRYGAEVAEREWEMRSGRTGGIS